MALNKNMSFDTFLGPSNNIVPLPQQQPDDADLQQQIRAVQQRYLEEAKRMMYAGDALTVRQLEEELKYRMMREEQEVMRRYRMQEMRNRPWQFPELPEFEEPQPKAPKPKAVPKAPAQTTEQQIANQKPYGSREVIFD